MNSGSFPTTQKSVSNGLFSVRGSTPGSVNPLPSISKDVVLGLDDRGKCFRNIPRCSENHEVLRAARFCARCLPVSPLQP